MFRCEALEYVFSSLRVCQFRQGWYRIYRTIVLRPPYNLSLTISFTRCFLDEVAIFSDIELTTVADGTNTRDTPDS